MRYFSYVKNRIQMDLFFSKQRKYCFFWVFLFWHFFHVHERNNISTCQTDTQWSIFSIMILNRVMIRLIDSMKSQYITHLSLLLLHAFNLFYLFLTFTIFHHIIMKIYIITSLRYLITLSYTSHSTNYGQTLVTTLSFFLR